MQVAAGLKEDAGSHFRAGVADHSDDWDILQHYLDIVVPSGCPTNLPQVLQGLEKLLPSGSSDDQVGNITIISSGHMQTS